jgi:hypothetical protein
MNYEDMQPTTRQKMAKPIPTTKPNRKQNNKIKHQRGDKNGLKLTMPLCKMNRFINCHILFKVRRFPHTGVEKIAEMR